MSKTAILAGVSATLGVLLVDAVIKNRQLRKDLVRKELTAEWYKRRYGLATEEVNYAFAMMDEVDQRHLRKFFNRNQSFLNVIEGRDAKHNITEVY